ncbi:MAG: CPBP family intramembrane glutamic endopeptidase [Bacteroidales bacterium]|nr:CPBP family intramembrane glutamic endopeptidase [Bacteroidales bacterium]
MTVYSELLPLSSKKPLVQFVVSMLLILIISLAGLLITLLTAWLIFGIAPGELDIWQEPLNAKHVNYFKYLQTFQHISMFLLPSLAIAFFMRGDAHSYLGLNNKPGLTSASLSILFIILIIPLNSYLSWFNSRLDLPGWLEGLENWMAGKESQSERLTLILMDAGSVGGLMINILIVALIPAVGEEFLYRGVLQNIFTRWLRSGHLGLILTALLFSAAHLQFYGFIPRFILGLGFGYLYLYSGNIWLPVLAHLVNNLIPTILAFFVGWESVNSAIDEFSAGDGLIATIPALIALLVLFNIRREGLRKD